MAIPNMKIFGMLRIKNEARWIGEVVESILPVCNEVLIFDDNSQDDTVAICERYPRVTVFRSLFRTLDESRDKNWLLDRINEIAVVGLTGDAVLCIDGDEVLERNGPELIRETLRAAPEQGPPWAWSLKIEYLWDSVNQVRVDGVYANFRRPSLFRLINKDFRYQTTPWGGNLHCSSIPQELIHGFGHCPARLKHYGYLECEKRIAKYRWYNAIDPNNRAEDEYRHVVQGDIPEVPASATLMHAGPLQFSAWSE